MSVYTEEYLKNKLIEKLEAVHVVSGIGGRTVDVLEKRDRNIVFIEINVFRGAGRAIAFIRSAK